MFNIIIRNLENKLFIIIYKRKYVKKCVGILKHLGVLKNN